MEAYKVIGILRIKDQNGEWQEIQAIKGDQGNDGYTPQKGIDYFDGEDYVLTEEDKKEIAALIEGEIIEPDLSGYATEDYVDNAIANIDIPEVDLSGYATIDEMNQAIAENQPDLSGYAKTEDIPDVSAYQTAEQVEAAINNALSSIGVAEEGEY